MKDLEDAIVGYYPEDGWRPWINEDTAQPTTVPKEPKAPKKNRFGEPYDRPSRPKVAGGALGSG